MKGPFSYLVDALIKAYLKGREWQIQRLDLQLKQDAERNKQLRRIADSLDAIMEKLLNA